MDMAKRKYSKMKKIQPAVQKFFFDIETTGFQDVWHIDLSQCASLMNRRFYRQGINWAVAGFKLHTEDNGLISINKLPNTWVMSNAWEKSFRAWQRMIKNATDESGSASVIPKFLDFKIFADQYHHANGFASNLLPHSSNRLSGWQTQVATPGEWVPAHVELSDASNLFQSWDLIAVGGNDPGVGPTGNDAKSIIQGYADSRALPSALADPNVPADAPQNWMLELFGSGTDQDEEVVAELIASNNIAPYPFENDGASPDTMYPGGENNLKTLEQHSFDLVTTSTIGGQTFIPGGNFPCGLVQIVTELFPDRSNLMLEVQLVPGDHRGYLCEPMTEM